MKSQFSQVLLLERLSKLWIQYKKTLFSELQETKSKFIMPPYLSTLKSPVHHIIILRTAVLSVSHLLMEDILVERAGRRSADLDQEVQNVMSQVRNVNPLARMEYVIPKESADATVDTKGQIVIRFVSYFSILIISKTSSVYTVTWMSRHL